MEATQKIPKGCICCNFCGNLRSGSKREKELAFREAFLPESPSYKFGSSQVGIGVIFFLVPKQ